MRWFRASPKTKSWDEALGHHTPSDGIGCPFEQNLRLVASSQDRACASAPAPPASFGRPGKWRPEKENADDSSDNQAQPRRDSQMHRALQGASGHLEGAAGHDARWLPPYLLQRARFFPAQRRGAIFAIRGRREAKDRPYEAGV